MENHRHVISRKYGPILSSQIETVLATSTGYGANALLKCLSQDPLYL
jgi:hypothetical protein